jgi:hypothetical protein
MSSSRLPARLLVLLLALIGWTSSEAAPTVGSVSVDPATVVVGTLTVVKVTTLIGDSSVIASSVFLQRLNPDGTVANLGVMRDDGGGGDATANDRVFTLAVTFNEPHAGTIRLRVSAAFRGILRRAQSDVLAIPVGVVLPPEFGVTVRGTGGTVVTVEPASTHTEVVVGITTTAPATIVAPAVKVSVVTAVEIVFDATELAETFVNPGRTLEVTVPAPAGTPSSAEFIVAQQALVDSTDGVSGLRPQLIARAFAGVVGSNIVTRPSPLPGVNQAGTYAVVSATGSGFAAGVVSDASGPAAGVVVSNSTNSLVAITDATGTYSLFISGNDPFTLTAFHPLRASRGTAPGTLPGPGLTATVNIALSPLATAAPTRDGIRNGGFERCVQTPFDAVGNLTGSWTLDGDARAVREFVTVSGVVIRATEGKCMAQISTASGATGSITQRFVVPAGSRTLSFDFNFVSEELDEYIGSVFNDAFTAVVRTPEGETTIVRVQVNDFMTLPGEFTMIGDCVPGGDETCGQTGWVTATVDLSRFSAPSTPVTVDLIFSVADRGDALFDTSVFIDNIRFGTVWVDAKILPGASADLRRVEDEVRQATEILSQAGVNVQLRGMVSVGDPGDVTNVETTWTLGGGVCLNPAQIDARLTVDEALGMTVARSAIGTDINLYYVKQAMRPLPAPSGPLTAVAQAGYAIGSDEFCNQVRVVAAVDFTGSGIFLMNYAIGNIGVLAHEIGHLILGPDPYSSNLEHNVKGIDPSNFMVGSPMPPPNGVLNRTQSANINRPGAPYILP